MSVEEQGVVDGAKSREESRRQPRRRWRTLQNRIERARQYRRALPGSTPKGRPSDGNAPQGA